MLVLELGGRGGVLLVCMTAAFKLSIVTLQRYGRGEGRFFQKHFKLLDISSSFQLEQLQLKDFSAI